MNVCLDTNVWVRYFIGDDKKKLMACRQIVQAVRQGIVRPYIPSTVILEVYWVLTSVYKSPKQKAQRGIEAMVETRGVVLLDKTDVKTAFSLHKKTGVKLADCLIATQLDANIVLCTYDEEFRKLPFLSVMTPREVNAALTPQI